MANRNSFKTHEEYLAYHKDYREKNREKLRITNKKWRQKSKYSVNGWSKSHKMEVAAHRFLNQAVKCHKIKKLPCSVCGSKTFIRAHHEDYTKPLDVIWLCEKHHREVHKKESPKE